jgi:hypothetical protein
MEPRSKKLVSSGSHGRIWPDLVEDESLFGENSGLETLQFRQGANEKLITDLNSHVGVQEPPETYQRIIIQPEETITPGFVFSSCVLPSDLTFPLRDCRRLGWLRGVLMRFCFLLLIFLSFFFFSSFFFSLYVHLLGYQAAREVAFQAQRSSARRSG